MQIRHKFSRKWVHPSFDDNQETHSSAVWTVDDPAIALIKPKPKGERWLQRSWIWSEIEIKGHVTVGEKWSRVWSNQCSSLVRYLLLSVRGSRRPRQSAGDGSRESSSEETRIRKKRRPLIIDRLLSLLVLLCAEKYIEKRRGAREKGKVLGNWISEIPIPRVH